MVGQEDDEWSNCPKMEADTYEPDDPQEDLVNDKKGMERLPPIEHLRERLNHKEFERLQSILLKHIEAFQKDKKDIGLTDLIEHEIELVPGAQPHKETVRRLNPEKQRQAAEEVEDFINKGVVVPSKSPWAAVIVMAKKKDPGTMRLCIDFRMLNDRTIKDAYPLPRIDDSVASLGVARFFTVLDMGSAFWEIPLRVEDQIKIAFATPKGLHHWTRMPFGLCNATATFQRLLNKVLMGIPEERGNFVMCYVDDILIASTTIEKHLKLLDEVFGRIKMAGLRCKPAKCELLKESIKFLGRVVEKGKMRPDESMIETVLKWTEPRSVKEVQSFLGFANYSRDFIPDFSEKAHHFKELTKKNKAW